MLKFVFLKSEKFSITSRNHAVFYYLIPVEFVLLLSLEKPKNDKKNFDKLEKMVKQMVNNC